MAEAASKSEVLAPNPTRKVDESKYNLFKLLITLDILMTISNANCMGRYHADTAVGFRRSWSSPTRAK